jgi:hypothetical protein
MAPQYSEIVDLLIDGARYNDAEDVQSALDQGADINSQDEQGRSGMSEKECMVICLQKIEFHITFVIFNCPSPVLINFFFFPLNLQLRIWQQLMAI